MFYYSIEPEDVNRLGKSFPREQGGFGTGAKDIKEGAAALPCCRPLTAYLQNRAGLWAAGKARAA